MSNNEPQLIIYRLYAQQGDDRIILQNLITGSYISATAAEIINNDELIRLLDIRDLSILRFIAQQFQEELIIEA